MSTTLPDIFHLDRATTVSLAELRGRLRADIRDLARELFGEPASTKGASWRWRKNLSLRVYVSGARQGAWRDELENTGGDPFAAIATARRMTFAESVRWAAERYGLARPSITDPEQEARATQRRTELAERSARDTAEAEAKRARDIAKAQALWAAGVAIPGTLVEHHLTEVRGLPMPASGWPSCVRYHPPTRALLVAITTEAGDVHSVQRILLDARGQNLRSGTDGRKLKLATGPYYGACGRIEARETESPVLVHGEGFETTATPCIVAGYEGRVWFGGIAGARLERGRVNVILRDDDRSDGPAARAADAAIERWRIDGYTIVVAPPFAVPRGKKEDWNDLLRDGGADAVRARLTTVIPPIEPADARPSVSMAQTRLETRAALEAWFNGQGADHVLVRGATGTGKTQMAVEIFAYLEEERHRERDKFVWQYRLDNRCSVHVAERAADAAGLLPLRARYLAETHELVGQTVHLVASFGITTAHDGGYDTPFDPARKDGPAACSQPTLRKLTVAAGAAMIPAACGIDLDGPHCPDRATCLHHTRRAECGRAAFVGMVIERAFDHFLPHELSRGFDFTIIDEGLDRVAYGTSEMPLRCLADRLFNEHPVRGVAGEPDAKGEPDPVLTAEARAGFAEIRFAFNTVAAGYVTPPMDPEKLSRLIALTEARDTDFRLTPATPEREREAIAVRSFRPAVRSLCGMLRAMADGPGRVSVKGRGDNEEERVAIIAPRRTMHPLFVDGRVLLIDATGDLRSVRRFLPEAMEIAPPLPCAPHQFAVQIVKGAGKVAMRNTGRLDYLHALVRLYGRGQTGVMTHLEHEGKFSGLDAILGHPGATAGRNDWKCCSTFFNFGLPSLSPAGSAGSGAERTGKQVPPEMPRRILKGVAMRGGGVEYVPSMAYANEAQREAQEAVRERHAIQGPGRPRGANRGPDDPNTLIHVGTTPLPHVELGALILSPGQHAPERFVRMAAAGLVVASGPDRSRLHPPIYTEYWTTDYDRKFEIGGTHATLLRVLFPAWPGPATPWCAGLYWVAGRGHRKEGRVFACPTADLEASKSRLRSRCKATHFRITERVIQPARDPLEVTRTQLKTALLNPVLVTCQPEETPDPIAPVWMVAHLGSRPDSACGPPDG